MSENCRFESDVALSAHCMDVLVRNVGLLETERFIAHLSRERMDYTEWRQGQFDDMSLEDLARATRETGKRIREARKMESALQDRSTGGKEQLMA